MTNRERVTQLLQDRGDQSAADVLLPLLYDDLHRIADRMLGGRGGAVSITPTTIVHEAYVRLVDQERTDYRNRTHFVAIASIAIRRVFVDLLRRQRALRRGGGVQRATLSTCDLTADAQDVDVLDLHAAIETLAGEEPRAARLVELRFFGGLSMAEAASELGISTPTAERDWRFARAWLMRALA